MKSLSSHIVESFQSVNEEFAGTRGRAEKALKIFSEYVKSSDIDKILNNVKNNIITAREFDNLLKSTIKDSKLANAISDVFYNMNVKNYLKDDVAEDWPKIKLNVDVHERFSDSEPITEGLSTKLKFKDRVNSSGIEWVDITLNNKVLGKLLKVPDYLVKYGGKLGKWYLAYYVKDTSTREWMHYGAETINDEFINVDTKEEAKDWLVKNIDSLQKSVESKGLILWPLR